MSGRASLAEAVAHGAARLMAAGRPDGEARVDAAVLARHVLQWDLATWLGHHRDLVPSSFAADFDRAITRRAAAEPVAYITGQREFYGRAFRVTPAVLVPRPETELLVERALTVIDGAGATSRPPSALDIGTGSGAIAVTLMAERPAARVAATDISPDALDVARDNAARHGVNTQLTFHEGAFVADAVGPWDLIVSNPPYVADADRGTLAPDVVGHEPHLALFSGADGLTCIREIVRLAPANLVPGGWLLFEFGFGQAHAVRALIDATRELRFLEFIPDLQGIPRVAVARHREPVHGEP